jgi:TPP-dependent pyruvate/acetoin dehydrogenase alpha subunit
VVEVVMPAHGMAMIEGVLIRWLKQPGDLVAKDEPIAEIETDKTNAEVMSPSAGVMGRPRFEPGATVRVGVALVEILDVADGTALSGTPYPADLLADRSDSDSHVQETVANVPPRRRRRAGSWLEELAQLATLDRIPTETQIPVVDLTGFSRETVAEWLSAMVLIREFEEVSDALASAGKIPGGIHSAAGQEAVAIGTVRALASTDIVTSTHRSHHHSLAKGLTPRSVMAELYGKATGCLGGRAGHMHLADFSRGLFGSNGVVGGGLGIALGAALAADMRGLEQVAVGHFGDGGANTGRVWEFVNLASIWKLPLIIVCENNQYAVESHMRRMTAASSIAERAQGFGLPAVSVDGQDVAVVYHAVTAARERALTGAGPTFIEAVTYRYQGHNTGDRGRYREDEEIETWRRLRDPIARLQRAAEEAGFVDRDAYDVLVEEARRIVSDAVDFAERSGWPDPATAADNVTGLRVSMDGST